MADKMEFPDYDPYTDDYDRGYEDAEQEYKSKLDKAIAEIEGFNVRFHFANYSEAFQLGVARGLDLASESLKEI